MSKHEINAKQLNAYERKRNQLREQVQDEIFQSLQQFSRHWLVLAETKLSLSGIKLGAVA